MTETEENRLAGEPVGDFSGMVSKHTVDGVCFYASPACRDLLGYEPGDLVGLSPRELVHPGDRAAVERFYSELAASQNAGAVAYRAVRGDGNHVRLEVTGWAMRDPDTGEVGEILAVSRGAVAPGADAPSVPAEEAAERRRAEDALRASEEMYRTVVEHVAENIFVVDVETGRILEANAAFSGSLGYGPREIQDLTLYDLVAHDRESIDRNIKLVLERGSLDVGEREYRRADGTLMDVEVRVSVIRYRGGRALCVVAHDVTGRKRVEEALRRSEERLRTISETEPECVKVLDPEGRLLEMNRAGLAMVEADSLEAVRGRPVDGLVLPEYREAFRALHRRVLGGGSGMLEFELVGLKGTHRWLETHAVPLRDGADEIVGQLSVTRDISARKHAEERLLRSEAGLANAQRITHLGNWEWDLVKGEAHWSDELYRIYGYAPQAFEPPVETFIDPVHPDDRARVQRANGEALGGGEPYDLEHRLFRPDGSERVVHCQAEVLFDRSGEAVRVVGTVQDITERRRTEDELRESHALLSSVVEGIPDAVFVKDLRGHYLLVNGMAAETIQGPGAVAGDIIGRDDTEFFPPEVAETLMELDRLIAETGEARVAEELVPIDGESRVYLSTKAPYRDHRGETIGVIGVSTDITESKELEKALFEARESERGRIARDLHDTVLHHIVGVLQNMQASQIEDPRPRGERAWQVEALRGAIQGLRNAIYNLRPERTEPFVRTIESLVELNRHLAPDCEFVVRAGDGPPREPFETAKVDLVRIVQEALTNARRHSGAGRVEVRLETDADGEFLAEVADDGRGLDPEVDLDGVGLSAMRERALVMGARLVIASVPGVGTRVRVSVPNREPGGAPGRRPGPRG